jgi:epoxyqueuosine reductase
MPDLLAFARLSPAQFKSRFRESPILRATRDGFVRNVVVALGNSGNHKSLPVLAETLNDRSPLVRSHAAWALGRLSTPRALQYLDSARETEKVATVREEIIEALKQH